MKIRSIALLTSALTLGAISIAQAAPVKIAVLMYGNKAEFVQLMERYGKAHPAVKSGEAVLTFMMVVMTRRCRMTRRRPLSRRVPTRLS